MSLFKHVGHEQVLYVCTTSGTSSGALSSHSVVQWYHCPVRVKIHRCTGSVTYSVSVGPLQIVEKGCVTMSMGIACFNALSNGEKNFSKSVVGNNKYFHL